MTDSIERALGHIEAKLDLVLEANRDQEQRISSLEHSRIRIHAYAAFVAAVATAGWQLVTHFLSKTSA